MNTTKAPYLHRVADYAELWSQVDFTTFDIPERFNLGVACVDDQNADDTALIVVARTVRTPPTPSARSPSRPTGSRTC